MSTEWDEDSAEAPVHSSRARGSTAERLRFPGKSSGAVSTSPSPGHLPQQRPDRSEKCPTEQARSFRLPPDPAPGIPHSGPDSPAGHDIIDSTLRVHRGPPIGTPEPLGSSPASHQRQTLTMNATMGLPIRQKRFTFGAPYRGSRQGISDRLHKPEDHDAAGRTEASGPRRMARS